MEKLGKKSKIRTNLDSKHHIGAGLTGSFVLQRQDACDSHERCVQTLE